MKKQLIFTFTLLTLATLLISIVNAEPSTVGFSNTNATLEKSHQRKVFYAQGLFWLFYSGDLELSVPSQGFMYKTSRNGVLWSSPTWINFWTGDASDQQSLDYNGEYFALVHSDEELCYNLGSPNSDGTITWLPKNSIYPLSALISSGATVCLDSEGYPWITYYPWNDINTESVFYLTTSSINDGTWITASGFPYQLSEHIKIGAWKGLVVPLADQKVYVIYADGYTIYGRLCSRESDGYEEVISTNGAQSLSAAAVGNDVYLVYTDSQVHAINYQKRSYVEGWSTPEVLEINGIAISSNPILTVDKSSARIYVFWQTANRIYVKTMSPTSNQWSSSKLITTDATHNTILNLNGFYQVWDEKIGVAWQTEASTIMFNFFTTQSLIPVETTPEPYLPTPTSPTPAPTPTPTPNNFFEFDLNPTTLFLASVVIVAVFILCLKRRRKKK